MNDYEHERRSHMWYQNYSEFSKNPRWSWDIETYETEETVDGVRRPVIYFRDESGEWEEAWISSTLCLNLEVVR